jgi:hypothetical protein
MNLRSPRVYTLREPKNAGRCDGGEPQHLICSWCLNSKLVSAFHADQRNKKHGRTTVCKVCKSARRREEYRELQIGIRLAREARTT